jgi:hypothetical protein
VFFFGTFHVLILYAWNRIAGVLEFDEAVYEEIQRRAALVPPAQRQAAIDAMVKDRVAIGMAAVPRKRAAEKAAKKSLWSYWLVCLVLAWVVWFIYTGYKEN